MVKPPLPPPPPTDCARVPAAPAVVIGLPYLTFLACRRRRIAAGNSR
jgi:hypothetical protein